MVLNRPLLGLLVGCSIACGARPHAMRVFSPRCQGEADLEPSMASQVAFMDRTFDALGLATIELDMPSSAEFFRAMDGVSDGWLFVSYTGHGTRPSSGPSEICMADGEPAEPRHCRAARNGSARLSVDDCLLRSLPKTLSGATLVLDACQSATVDPTLSPIPTTVISSSPYIIDSNSLFGDRLAVALREAAEDPNCDGLVTDQELFDALVLNIYRETTVAENRAYPKLRRNAPSHLPLPLTPVSRPECAAVRSEMRRIAGMSEKHWQKLAKGLRDQLALDPASKDKARLPDDPCDYFVLDPECHDPELVRETARGTGLCEFPGGDLETAKKVARFATFTEVYHLSGGCEWSRVTRLRDEMLVAVERTAALDRALPMRRTDARVPTDQKGQCQFRYSRVAPADGGRGVHCAEAEGQCFLEPCAK